MASRSSSGSGSGSGSNHRRSRQPPDDFPPLPAPRISQLRNVYSPPAMQGTSPNHPTARTWSTTARRADRIRRLDEQAPSLDDLDQSMEQSSWLGSSRHGRPRSRDADVQRTSFHERTGFQELDDSLDDANAQLHSLLHVTNRISLTSPLMRTSFTPPPPRRRDFPEDNRRSKRRKIDANRLASSARGFRYGRYGQVEPGQLHMEIVSCDGGMFSNESSFAAENILRNDNSVYCTKGNRCNIVLRHQGATIFTLRELVIKAPCSMNYSHPVREGMVFVAMNQDDVLSRTAQYQIQYLPPTRDCPCHEFDDGLHPYDRQTISIRHHDDGTISTRARRSFLYRDDGTEDLMPHMPLEFSRNLPDFHVATECSDDEEDDGDVPHMYRRPPDRIGSLPFETADSDSEGAYNPFGSEEFLDASPRHGPTPHHGGDRDRLGISLAEAWDAHASATQEAVRAVGGELLVPHARFFIETKKSKCTIRFDPPVSGRFILLKMWSSRFDTTSNIDIQSIIARGFSGPRYFPSVSLS
ncbi:hypothetical protein RJ55_04175 [Drechmeria coniospora]|nr:hypothetical protein RJ55_04175 [Drechmeria coniospora]